MKMKNRLLVLMLFLYCTISNGQAPETINFQAQARGVDGKLMDNKTVKTRISILELSASASPIYVETQTSLTDQMGLYNLLIGNGPAQTGSFQSIDWSIQPKYIQVELDTDDGVGFKLISTFQLATVPYAFYANTAKQAESYNETDPDFSSSVAKGITQADTMRWNVSEPENWSTQASALYYNMGSVGIGTDAPRSLLDVVSNEGEGRYSFNASNTNAQGQAGTAFWNSNGGWLKLALLGDQVADGAALGQSGEATSQILSNFGAKDMLIGTLNDQSLFLGTNNLPRLSILNNGKIGIGTTSPFQNLDIRADSPDTETKVAIGNSDHTNYIEFFGGRTSDPNPFVFWKGNTLRFVSSENEFSEKMVITNAGQVGIGVPIPNSKLSVAGSIESTEGGFKFPDGTTQSTSSVSFSGDMGNQPITNLSDPINEKDAATKAYVDILKNQIKALESILVLNGLVGLQDIDGNNYLVVKVGNQVWMAENLRTTKFSNGDVIPTTTPANLNISNESSPIYQWAYNGSEELSMKNGRLYTWFTATDNRNVCPTGWRVATDNDWLTLGSSLGDLNVAGGKLKESGNTNWIGANVDATNSSGFTALPSGSRNLDNFDYLGSNTYFWTNGEYDSEIGYHWRLSTNNGELSQSTGHKYQGYSIRCLKD